MFNPICIKRTCNSNSIFLVLFYIPVQIFIDTENVILIKAMLGSCCLPIYDHSVFIAVVRMASKWATVQASLNCLHFFSVLLIMLLWSPCIVRFLTLLFCLFCLLMHDSCFTCLITTLSCLGMIASVLFFSQTLKFFLHRSLAFMYCFLLCLASI